MGFNEGFRGNPDRRGGQGQGRPGGSRPGFGAPSGANRSGSGDSEIDSVLAAVDLFMNTSEDSNGQVLIENAMKLGAYLNSRDMTSSQIRSLYVTAKKINYEDCDGPYEVSMLRARFAYAAGRHKKQVGPFQKVADRALARVKSAEEFRRFMDFFEAVVAYHRAYGGRE